MWHYRFRQFVVMALIAPVYPLFHTNTDLPHIYGVGAVYSKLQYMAIYGTYF